MEALNNIAANAGTPLTFCTPILVSAAIFIAIVVLDLFQKEYEYVLGHIVWGIIATLLISILCQKGMGFAAWVLLFVPVILILLGLLYVKIEEQRKERAKVKAMASPVIQKKPLLPMMDPM
jgi:hypothetical protein